MKLQLAACCLALTFALPLKAADLSALITEAAKYESGRSLEPLKQLERLVLESAAKPENHAELEAALVKLLAPSATYEARRFACQQLMIIGTEASMEALGELLKHDETVGIACLALSSQRSPKAVEMLCNALSSSRGRTHLQLISALGNHADAQSVKVLAEMTRDADAAVAQAAVIALGKIASHSSGEIIAALAKEIRPDTAWAVTEAFQRRAEHLAASGDRKTAAAMYEQLLHPDHPVHLQRGALAALLRLDDDGELRILQVLNSSNAVLKPVAIAAIGTLDPAAASTKFVAALPKLQPSEQVLMIEALATRNDPSARAALRANVSASSAAVRRAAIRAVGKQEDASAVPLLTKALANSSSTEEREIIELALASLQGQSATDQAIISELNSSSGDVKIGLCSALALRGAHAAVPTLLAEARSSDTAMAQAAFRAVGILAMPSDLPALLETLMKLGAAGARADAEDAAARVLAKLPEVSRRSEAVRQALHHTSDTESRSSLLRLLAHAADTQALTELKTACQDQKVEIREAAVRALSDWPDTAAWDPLLAMYRQPEHEKFRALALRALVRLANDLNPKPNAELMRRYRQLLSAARSDVDRKLILGALAGATHPDALEIARSTLSHPGVRAEAELALQKISEALETKK